MFGSLNMFKHVMCFFLWPVRQCSPGLGYRECISCCPASCNLERTCIDSKLACLDGCYCPDGTLFPVATLFADTLYPCSHVFCLPPGLIYEDGGCVVPSDCPCEYHGVFYPPGHILQEECNNWSAASRATFIQVFTSNHVHLLMIYFHGAVLHCQHLHGWSVELHRLQLPWLVSL